MTTIEMTETGIVTESAVATATATSHNADGMHRFYELAKRQAWDVRGLSWGGIAPVPEGNGTAAKKARRHSMWRSVVTQQLQADMIAVQCSVQLLNDAPDYEAKLYYTTMTQDEARHLEAWLRLSNEIGGVCEPDPHLAKLGQLAMGAATLEARVWLFQCAFEGLVIPRFRQIANAAPGTILAEICRKLQIDDGIHHGSGICYERMLLENSTAKTKRDIASISKEMWPLYAEHLMWRPRERAWASSIMRARDAEMVTQQAQDIEAMAAQFGIEVDMPR